jgi:rRNA-processing protein FCF1
MSVKLRELSEIGAKYREKRRGRRMNSRVRIRLEWDGEASKRHAVEAVTRVVNPYGCMVVLSESLELEQRLALTNLATQASNAAVIVWRGNQEPEGWEYGVELVAPDMDFWGLEL